jgi:hypothetical protein
MAITEIANITDGLMGVTVYEISTGGLRYVGLAKRQFLLVVRVLPYDVMYHDLDASRLRHLPEGKVAERRRIVPVMVVRCKWQTAQGAGPCCAL